MANLFAKHRCCLSADGQSVVAETDAKADSLLAVRGRAIPEHRLRGLNGVDEFFQSSPILPGEPEPEKKGPLVTIKKAGEQPEGGEEKENHGTGLPGAGAQPSGNKPGKKK